MSSTSNSSASEYEEQDGDDDSDFDPDVVDVTNKPAAAARTANKKKPPSSSSNKASASTKTNKKPLPPVQPKKRKLSTATSSDEDGDVPDHPPAKKKAAPPPAAKMKEPSPKKKKKKTKVQEPEADSYDILVSNKLGNSGECTVLVQIDEEDASTLDFTGAVGAIGRLETDNQGVVLDLKGCQYRGRIFPGPTAMVLSVVNSSSRKQQAVEGQATIPPQPQLKIDGVTDEFCRLVKTGVDAMSQLDAVVQGEMEDYARVLHNEDVDVNRNVKQSGVSDEAIGKDESVGNSKSKRKKLDSSRSQPKKKPKKAKA